MVMNSVVMDTGDRITTGQRQSQTVEQIEILERAVENLRNDIKTLEDRMVNVIRKNVESPTSDKEAKVAQSLVPLADRIRIVNANIHELGYIVESLSERFEA